MRDATVAMVARPKRGRGEPLLTSSTGALSAKLLSLSARVWHMRSSSRSRLR
jgi:hypothetical protein